MELPTSHFSFFFCFLWLNWVHSFFCSIAIVGIFTACPDLRARTSLLETRGVSGHAPQMAKYWSGQNRTSRTACAGPDTARPSAGSGEVSRHVPARSTFLIPPPSQTSGLRGPTGCGHQRGPCPQPLITE